MMNADNASEMNLFFTTLKIRNANAEAGQHLLEAYGRQQVQAAMAP